MQHRDAPAQLQHKLASLLDFAAELLQSEHTASNPVQTDDVAQVLQAAAHHLANVNSESQAARLAAHEEVCILVVRESFKEEGLPRPSTHRQYGHSVPGNTPQHMQPCKRVVMHCSNNWKQLTNNVAMCRQSMMLMQNDGSIHTSSSMMRGGWVRLHVSSILLEYNPCFSHRQQALQALQSQHDNTMQEQQRWVLVVGIATCVCNSSCAYTHHPLTQ